MRGNFWASKITIKNFQLCSIKIKGSHAPCDINATALYCNVSPSAVPVAQQKDSGMLLTGGFLHMYNHGIERETCANQTIWLCMLHPNP